MSATQKNMENCNYSSMHNIEKRTTFAYTTNTAMAWFQAKQVCHACDNSFLENQGRCYAGRYYDMSYYVPRLNVDGSPSPLVIDHYIRPNLNHLFAAPYRK